MKRRMVVMCLVILASCFFAGQDFVVAQVSTCSECDSRFVNASGDKIRKLTVKRDLKVKRDLTVDGNIGIGTTSPSEKLEVSGNVKASSFSGDGSTLSFGSDSNMQPFLGINFIIALQGVYPSRNTTEASSDPILGGISMFAGNFAPRGWAFCDGQLLPINQHQALYSLLGTIYGGDGRTTFALPDLRGRVPLHPGTGPGLTPRTLGQKGGTEQVNGF